VRDRAPARKRQTTGFFSCGVTMDEISKGSQSEREGRCEKGWSNPQLEPKNATGWYYGALAEYETTDSHGVTTLENIRRFRTTMQLDPDD